MILSSFPLMERWGAVVFYVHTHFLIFFPFVAPICFNIFSFFSA